MKGRLFLGGLIGCLIVIIALYILSRSGPETGIEYDTPQQEAAVRGLNNDRTTNPLPINVDTWEAWIDKWTDVAVRKYVALAAEEGWHFNDEQLADVRNYAREIMVGSAEKAKQESETPPLWSENDIEVTFAPPPPDAPVSYDTTGKKHTGPQTVAALMASFHRPSKSDERYPPEQWLQMLLDRGLTMQNEAEYAEYMGIRGVLTTIEDNPQNRAVISRSHGISESDVAAVQAAVLEQELGFYQKLHNARRANHLVGDIILVGPNNDIVLPFYVDRKMTYIQHSDHGTIYRGSLLTDWQRFKLFLIGVEPEGIEIIHIDRLGNILEEPPPYYWKEFVRKMFE